MILIMGESAEISQIKVCEEADNRNTRLALSLSLVGFDQRD
jgi:hypothetical protein